MSGCPSDAEWDEKRRKWRGPSEIAGYQVGSKLGSGSFGTVYEVRNGCTLAAIKVIKDELTSDDLMDMTLPLLTKHRNIMPVLKVFRFIDEEGKKVGILMPLAKSTLTKELKSWEEKKINPTTEQRFKRAAEIWCGIMALHATGFLHLDLKPDNILIDNNDIAVLNDFGLAQATFGSHASRAPWKVITSLWRPPNLSAGHLNLSERDDWWSYVIIFLQIMFDIDPYSNIESLENILRNNRYPNDRAIYIDAALVVLRDRFIETPGPMVSQMRSGAPGWNKIRAQLCAQLLSIEKHEMNRPLKGVAPTNPDELKAAIMRLTKWNETTYQYWVNYWTKPIFDILMRFALGLLQFNPADRTANDAILIFSFAPKQKCIMFNTPKLLSPSNLFIPSAFSDSRYDSFSINTRVAASNLRKSIVDLNYKPFVENIKTLVLQGKHQVVNDAFISLTSALLQDYPELENDFGFLAERLQLERIILDATNNNIWPLLLSEPDNFFEGWGPHTDNWNSGWIPPHPFIIPPPPPPPSYLPSQLPAPSLPMAPGDFNLNMNPSAVIPGIMAIPAGYGRQPDNQQQSQALTPAYSGSDRPNYVTKSLNKHTSTAIQTRSMHRANLNHSKTSK